MLERSARVRDPTFSVKSGRLQKLIRNVDSQVFVCAACESPVGWLEGDFMKELDILRFLRHPNVVGLVGFYLREGDLPWTMLTEWMPKRSLAHLISSPGYGTQTSTVKAQIILGIILGMRYCHSRGIVHRNLTPSNILLTDMLEAKIGDFRFAETLHADELSSPALVNAPEYTAPEVRGSDSGGPADVFSFGIILWEMTKGKKAFTHIPWSSIRRRIRDGLRPDLTGVQPVVSALLKKCWSQNPVDRPTFDWVLNELRSRDYQCFPDVDGIAVGRYVESVLTSEQSNPVPPL
jgi:serine/threonine protein kinase